MKRNKFDKADWMIVTFLIALVVAVFTLAYYSEPSTAPEHGSYLKCDFYTVKGACARWSVVTY